jgi:hypothetical protein
MKTTESLTETSVCEGRELSFCHRSAPLLPPRDKRSFIQWTTDHQIQEVSKMLARIEQSALRLEVDGDYFKSGDLAYQIKEIIRATAELFKKSQRAKG